MQVSAEIRWFWKRDVTGLKDWFCEATSHRFPAGGGSERKDVYLRDPDQDELGIKRRGGKEGVEVKGLVLIIEDQLSEGTFKGQAEIWTKWTSGLVKLTESDSVISLQKRRWLRKFSTDARSLEEIKLNADEKPLEQQLPERGCNVELTEIKIQENSKVWWTFGFESFGNLSTVESDLRAVAKEMATRNPNEFGGGMLASYPAWLQHVLNKS